MIEISRQKMGYTGISSDTDPIADSTTPKEKARPAGVNLKTHRWWYSRS